MVQNVNRLVALELGFDESDFGIEAADAGAGVGPVEVGIGNMFLVSDNMAAIRKYFADTSARTDAASKIKDDFIKWYDALWWYEKGEQSNYDLARNMRNRFNLANAVTPVERASVENVMKTGLTTEQMVSEEDRRLSTGMMPGPVKPPNPPLIPTPWLIGGAVVAGLAVIFAAKGAAEQAVKKAI
jgi:hypothetical protein